MIKAFITGVTGQDGSYLAELLLSKGYEVHGLIRRASTFNTKRIDHIYRDPHHRNGVNLHLHYGDVSNTGNLMELIYNIQPEEVYHLAAQSHVRVSFDLPEYTGDVTGLGTMRILEAIRKSGIKVSFLPSLLERDVWQRPTASKRDYAVRATKSVRRRQGVCVLGDAQLPPWVPDFCLQRDPLQSRIPRRGETFVTRKITRAVAHILAGKQEHLYLGNLDAKRDWGYAPDYIAAMWKMIQHDQPEDFVIGTGEAHSVREFLEIAFGYVNLDWQDYVRIDPRYFRPNEVDFLQADPSRAINQLGWEPRVFFKDLVRIMVDADLEKLGLDTPGEGRRILEKLHGRWHRWEDQMVSMDGGGEG